MNRKILIALVIFLTASVARQTMARDYIIGAGDLLNITVYDQPDLASQVRVSGEGNIAIPLAGEVKVAGLTVRGAEKRLTSLLADGYLKNPQVSVLVAEYRSRKVTVLGEVKNPGLYELTGDVSLIEMLSKAGGLTEKAGDTLIITRKAPAAEGHGTGISVNIKKLMENGDAASNLFLRDGDSIFVTTSGFVYVTGEVQRPGAYKVEKDTTVIKAITLAGGLTGKAAPGRTTLIRKAEGKEKKMRVDMGDSVQPDDVISVPESFF